MPTTIPLPSGSYKTVDPRASDKILVNCFSETAPQTSELDSKQKQPPLYLRRMFGISPFATTTLGTGVRGMWDMSGVTYAVIGQYLFTVSSGGVLTKIGAGISGQGFVRMTDNKFCLLILIPGTRVAYTYTTSSGLAQLSSATFLQLGAIDVWFVDSYMVFLALGGLQFYNDDGQIVSGTGVITFNTGGQFPREFGTDPFVGMCVDHRAVRMFGVRTSEGYTNTGNATFSPFSSAPDTFMQIGMHPDCSYSIALQDQSAFWVANDLTVRRMDGQTPIRVSNSGIESILELNKNKLAGCYAMAPTIGGHPLWILTIPLASRTLVYDCLTTEWFELESLIKNLGYWRPLSYYNAKGKQLVGDSLTGTIGYLDQSTFTEFGSPMRVLVATQSVYHDHERITHRRIEAVITPGRSTSITTGAKITLFYSDDGGNTYKAGITHSLGKLGQRQQRALWFQMGQSYDRCYAFQMSDPTPMFFLDIKATLEGGEW